MTELPPQTARADAPTDSLTDPRTLVDQEEVEHVQETRDHEDTDLFETIESFAGAAVVGVVDDEGATLLTVHDADDTLVLPYAMVDAGEDYVDAIVENVRRHAGVAIELDDVCVVREIEHHLASDDDRTTTTFDLVFEASPAPGASIADDAPLRTLYCGEPIEDDDYRTDWFHELPEMSDDMCDTTLGDVRRFFD